MKVLVGLVFILSIISACEKNDINFNNDFEKSQKAWLNFKNASNNSYQYTVANGSWVGSGWETKLTVTNGVVTERYYKYTPAPDSNQPIIEWTENENELNTHTDSAAAETITLDKIYEKAQQDWLLKRDDSQTLFEVNDDGLLFQAGYIPNNCADDCFVGITIRDIKEI
ncbi:hypothetical protein [Arcticibacterium luteifluviistationis]|uniref:Uncharacterized protein n=1 Tax=Arcticibacterium luteifluviistationis TaxID=1784714 RepID=A0A2Z4GH60_9BACT|nr:hypothetical protein [Arcticibacterium luteifluviistationis]AWW00365.1 hypothetical protein DJ013_20180 [Arcticibacterium luteifluviistationis]